MVRRDRVSINDDFHMVREKTEIMDSINSWMKSMISYCDPIADVGFRLTRHGRVAQVRSRVYIPYRTPPARPSGRSATGTARPTPHRGHRMRHADARWCDPIPNGRGACRAVPVIRSDAVPVITRRATIRTRHDVPIYSCSRVGVSREPWS